jgi:hypothetical protein
MNLELAACGLSCVDCDIRLAPTHPEIAEMLVAHFQKLGHTEACAAWFRCQGCRGERSVHWSADCKILLCCVDERGLENCSQCPDFPCAILEAFADDGYAHHRQAVERLHAIRNSS